MILFNKAALDEGGPVGAGPAPTGPSPAGGPGFGISTGDVLGHCDHAHGEGYMGGGCFHVPFPVMPMLTRWGWSTGKKGKKGKKVKNPYAAKMVVIQEDDEAQPIEYRDAAKKTFDLVVQEQDDIFVDVLYLNRKYMLAWKIGGNGKLTIYKPVEKDEWQIWQMELQENGKFKVLEKTGKFKDEADALSEIRKNVEDHKEKLDEALNGHDLNRWAATGFDPAKFPSLRSNPNIPFLQQELKRRFPGQFDDVRITNFGRYAITFGVRLPEGQLELRGQQRVAAVIPEINRIISFLRMRDVDINSYDITARSRI